MTTTTKTRAAKVKTAPCTDPAGKGHPGANAGQVRRTSVELDGGGPVCLIDSREQRELPVHLFLPVRVKALQSGDYSVAAPDQPEGIGLEMDFAIERKSLEDLVGRVTRDRDRFERELHRLRGFAFARLLVTSHPSVLMAHKYRSGVKPSTILASLSAFEIRYSVPVIWIPDEVEAARWVCRTAWFYWREKARLFRKVQPCGIDYAATATTLQPEVELAN